MEVDAGGAACDGDDVAAAGGEFCPCAPCARAGTPSALTLLPGRERLVVCRTMSKAFAAAGTRLG